MNARPVGALALATLLAACSLLVAPDERGPPAIVLSVPQSLADIFAEVNRVHLTITVPDTTPRTTVLEPVFEDGQIRARALLRPTEGAPGTLIDVELKRDALFLFRGAVSIGARSGWPYQVRVPIVPVATFGAGGDRVLSVGAAIDLSEEASIRFDDGRLRPAEGVAWITPDSSIVEVAGSSLTAAAVGEAAVIGVWVGQVDTVFVQVVAAR